MRYLFLLFLLSASVLAQYVPRSSSVSATVDNYSPVTDTWISYVRADAQAGSDGASLTTVAQTAGTAASYTGTATLRTGANGINNHNAFSFNGSNGLTAATGAASLNGDFYGAVVVRFNNLTGIQNLFSFGDSSSGKRRTLGKGGSGYYTDLLVFLGQSADNPSSASLTTGVNYLFEIIRAGDWIRMYSNGALVSDALTPAQLQSFSSTAINLGVNLSGGERFNGLLAEVALSNSVTIRQINSYRVYVANRYGITLPTNYGSTYATSTGSIESALLRTNASSLWFGQDTILTGGSVDGSFPNPATWSVHGNIAGVAMNSEHMLENYWDGKNVGSVWNRSRNGLSALRYLYCSDGKEMGAIGYSPGIEPWGEATYGSMYIEASDFHTFNQYGSLRIVQTFQTGASLRLDMNRAGDWVFYRQNGTSQLFRLNENGDVIFNTKTPASATATGTTGTITWDSSFIYVCVGTNTWKRAALSTW